MKERPILFSAPMVRALLAGTKTQTRRLIKPQPRPWPTNPAFLLWRTDEPLVRLHLDTRSPYGVPGDRLWVREAWGIAGHLKRDPGYVVYRADCDGNYDEVGNPVSRWRPSIFMKRDDSRITLEVTDVRAERLSAISEEDALAEGCRPVPGAGSPLYPSGRAARSSSTSRAEFQKLWDSINYKTSPWASNPWVWVVSLRRLP